MVLWGVLVALLVSSWLQGEIFPANGRFALCGKWNRQRCVIDGDTIRYNGLTIRLEGIDAPETHEPRCAFELALGERATDRLIELMNSGPFDVVYRGGRDVDRYGRRLRAIERDGHPLGDVLVAEGLARRWDGARRSWCG
jgi:micrococcal nuclease